METSLFTMHLNMALQPYLKFIYAFKQISHSFYTFVLTVCFCVNDLVL